MPGRHPGHVAEAPGGQAQQRAPSCSAPSLAAFISVAATRWGTWDTTATRRSWSAAESTSTSAPEAHHHALEAVEGLEVGDRGRREHPHRALEEVGVGAAQADLLGAGHGVAADEAGVVGRGDDGLLDPADVGHHRVGAAARVGQQPTATRRATVVAGTSPRRRPRPPGRHRRRRSPPAPTPRRAVPRRRRVPTRASPVGATPGRWSRRSARSRRRAPGGAPRPQSGRSSRSPWAPWR